MSFQFKALCHAAVLLFLTACGGSGGTNSETGNEFSRGAITGFGSVYVNGVRYNTDSAIISSDDLILTDVTQLKVGMVATVTGNASAAVASAVSFEEDVKGPVDTAVVDFSSPFSVMGQTVFVDSGTVIDTGLVLPLTAGDILEVSGLRQADDSILALYIDEKLPGNVNKFKVIGNARSVDDILKTFTIDGLLINYGTATVGDLSGGNPVEGQLLEVKDETRNYVAGTGTLVATKVEPFNFLTGANSTTPAASVEIESVVTSIVTPSQFSIPNFTVNIQPGTSFRFGTSADISVGTVLQIGATQNANGELDTNRIIFKRNSTRMEAPVDAGGVNVGNNQITVLGITVQIISGTAMEDKRDGISPFTIADITPSDYLRIRGFTGSNGMFIATSVERDNSDTKAVIRSVVFNVDPVALSLDILGNSVTAGVGTIYDNGASASGAFFTSLTNGLSVVSAKWDPFVNTGFAPIELTLEDDFSINKLSN